ncbi:C1 family peptidase [Xanthomonas albilineans]|uniref:Putative cysteine protease protein n=2 Tax=Xanthomonas albilineans TaxID=29447 RepID=D2UEH3_XANAP|nr:C1 family peptidase [Xanthomonas albilineans]PPU92262.1 peptidase C1 [Xanthomonas albilineans]CBA16547.1 putative cysteine protease protein [Xanthomonas albilineans GPE PC73]
MYHTRPMASLIGLLALSAFSVAHAQPHGMGLKPSPLTQPLVKLFEVDKVTDAKPPENADLTQWAIKPSDQKQLGACASFATARTLAGWYANFTKQSVNLFAPMYLYTQVNDGQDNGSTMEAPLDVALKQGIDTKADYFQGDYDWRTKPTKHERANARNYKQPFHYQMIYNNWGDNSPVDSQALIEQIKLAIANGTPVVIGFNVRAGFDSLNQDHDIDYDNHSKILDGHEVIALGYDKDGLLIENSWGTDWGKHGFGRLAWSVVAKDVHQAAVAY